MRKYIDLIQLAIIGISGLIHLSGLFNNGEVDFYIGLILTGAAVLSLVRMYVEKGMSLVNGNIVVNKREFKWSRLLDLLAILVMTYVLFFKDGMESILITLILYTSLNVIFDHNRTIMISDKHIFMDGLVLDFDSVYYIDIQPSHIFVSLNNDSTDEHVIDLTNVSPKDRDLVINRLAMWKATSASDR